MKTDPINGLPLDVDPEMVLLKVPAEVFEQAVEEAVRHILRYGLDDVITDQVQQYLEPRIKAMVAEEIEDSERFKDIRAEVYQQLTRWPAVKNDPKIKEAISKAILECFVKVVPG